MQMLEAFALLAAQVVVALVIFCTSYDVGLLNNSYWLFPLVIWAALRFGPRGVVLATVISSSLAIWGTMNGLGPFVRNGQTDSERLMLRQMFMAVTAVTGLVVGAVSVERQRAEESIQASLQEKEVLLKEIHHRVKNNLQLITSLFSLQARTTQDSQALEVLRESQDRVRSMALLHERLYQSDRKTEIDFGEYVRILTVELFHSYGVHTDAVQLQSSLPRTLLAVDVALPCGLIVNELMVNCLKHAFPNDRAGVIQVEFHSTAPGGYQLTVADNGVGMPESVDPETARSLGLRLVRALAKQLGANLDLIRKEGTKWVLRFSTAGTTEAGLKSERVAGKAN
jgi:two-component sensor histidine kinase